MFCDGLIDYVDLPLKTLFYYLGMTFVLNPKLIFNHLMKQRSHKKYCIDIFARIGGVIRFLDIKYTKVKLTSTFVVV